MAPTNVHSVEQPGVAVTDVVVSRKPLENEDIMFFVSDPYALSARVSAIAKELP